MLSSGNSRTASDAVRTAYNYAEHLPERATLQNRNSRLHRLLERPMNLKPQPLVTLQSRQEPRFSEPRHNGYVIARRSR